MSSMNLWVEMAVERGRRCEWINGWLEIRLVVGGFCVY